MPDSPSNVAYRVARLEHEVEQLDARLTRSSEIHESIAVLRAETLARREAVDNRLTHLEEAIEKRLTNLEQAHERDVRGIRRLLITFSLTVAGSAITFAVTTLVVFGAP